MKKVKYQEMEPQQTKINKNKRQKAPKNQLLKRRKNSLLLPNKQTSITTETNKVNNF